MGEMAKLISEYGILVFIAVLFFATFVADKKTAKEERRERNAREDAREIQREKAEKEQRDEMRKRDDEYRETIKVLSSSTDNVASALNLLRESENNTTTLIRSHDQRSIDIKEDIQKGFAEIKNDMTEVKTIVGTCGKRKGGE